MKKTITHLLLLLGIVATSNISAQNPTLSLPPSYRAVGFNFPLPTAPGGSGGYDGTAYGEPSSIYAGADGTPLLFAVPTDIPLSQEGYTTRIYNKNGYPIGALSHKYIHPQYGLFINSVRSNNETIIVPDPGNCKRFYVFATSEDETYEQQDNFDDGHESYTPFYALVDMSIQIPGAPTGEFGQIITPGTSNGSTVASMYAMVPNNQVGGRPLKTSTKIAVSKPNVNDGNSRLIFVFNDYYLFIYKLSASGITYKQMINMADTYNVGSGSYANRLGEMEIYEEGNTIKFAVSSSGIGDAGGFGSNLNLFNLDISTPVYTINSVKELEVSTTAPGVNFPDRQVSGVEFSPNGQYVYFTHETNNYHPYPVEWVEYANITNRQPVNAGNAIMNDFRFSQIELGLDGKMYMATSNRLATISNSNNPPSLSWNNNSVSLSAYPADPFGAYLLPDQVDQDNYGGFYQSTMACCNLYSSFSIDKEFYFPLGTTNLDFTNPLATYTVTGYDSGTNPMIVEFTQTSTARANVHIPAGANVTFKNMRFEFTPEYIPVNPSDPTDVAIPGAKLIVEKNSPTDPVGGMLTVNTSTLTVCTKCSSNRMWPGVEVLGYNNAATPNQGSFGSSIQGWMKINPGSKVEHAINGITIGDVNGGQGGGVVEGNSATIENCLRGLMVRTCGNIPANKTKFNRCTFQNTQALLSPDPTIKPLLLANLLDAVNIYFYGCNFKNLYAPYDNAYYGLTASNSLIHVIKSGFVISRFERLGFGLWAISAMPGRTVNCQNAEFTMNKVGAYVGTCNNAIFKNNVFKVKDDVVDPNYFSTGLYLDASSGFTVTGNAFSKTAPFPQIAPNATIGSVVNNSNVSQRMDNFIIKNTYSKLHFGAQSIDINYFDDVNSTAVTNDGGLGYYCNTFNAPIVWADMATSQINFPTSGINYHQGHSTGTNTAYTTGNKYSYTLTGSVKDILQDDNSYPFQSHWSNNIGNAEPKTVSSNVAPIFSANSTNPCGVNLYQLVENDIYTEVDSKVAELKTSIAEIQTKMAAGSSVALLELIHQAGNPGQIKNELMAVAPYASNDVLFAYLGSSPPQGHLQQVMQACSPLSSELVEKIESSKLPKGIKDAILSNQTGTSPFVVGNDLIRLYNAQIDWLYTEVIATYLADEVTPNAYEKALDYIKLSSKPGDCKGAKCRYELSVKNDAEALANLQILEQFLQAGNPKLEIHKILYELYGKDIKTELDTKPDMVIKLETIAVNTTDKESALLALSVLNYKREVSPLAEFIGLPVGSTSRLSSAAMTEFNETYADESEDLSSINNFPNPFTGKTTLTATVPANTVSAELVVIDVLGKEVARYKLSDGENAVTFENENATGILYYSLFVNGKRKATKMMLKD